MGRLDSVSYAAAVKRSAASRDAQELLRQALAGHGATVADMFDAVVGRSGTLGAYEVAWCLASATLGDTPAHGGWCLDFPDIENADYQTRWVARFLSAYANEDLDTGRALFHAAQASGHMDECLLTLAGSAAATIRRRGYGQPSGGA